MPDLKTIFSDIAKVDWRQLVHAYGRAEDVPTMLWKSVSDKPDEQHQGWDGIWGALNHQGDFYDSTVATIPFFIRFLACEEVPCRIRFLAYLYDRYLDATNSGGDPLVDDPPGGEDIPTPMLTMDFVGDRTEELDEPDWDNMRSMDLCAWQTGREIRAGMPVYKSLLNHPDKEIAGNAANLMLLWHESRKTAQAALRAAIDSETDASTKAELLLKYGVYSSIRDLDVFRYWTADTEPLQVRTAATICWARVIEPSPLPADLCSFLDAATAKQCRVFGDLPWLGVYNRGPWTLPNNMAHVLLQLAANDDDELRWRAVQGLMPGRKVERWLRREETSAILLQALTDSSNEVRSAAALALAEIGEDVLRHCPDAIDLLIAAIDDDDEGASGHASRLLATLALHLAPKQKTAALKRTKAAAKRFRNSGKYVQFMSLGIQADSFLMRQHDAIRQPVEWTLERIWQAYAFPDREDNELTQANVNRRLSDAFTADAEQVIKSAISVLTAASDRSVVLGAAKWLATIGPRAEQALPAIDSCGRNKFDSYIDNQMESARRVIAEAVQFEASYGARASGVTPEAGTTVFGIESGELSVDKLCELLHDGDWLVRFHAVSGLAKPRRDLRSEKLSDLQRTLQKLLSDESFDEISVAEEFQYGDQIYHWRRQRRSVAAAAIRALFALELKIEADELLDAMLRETTAAHVRCGDIVIVSEYSASEWLQACKAVPSGHISGELRVRAERQRCHRAVWSSNTYDPIVSASERHLQQAIPALSGRLVPHDEF